MAKKRFKAEEIVMKLREIELHTQKGMDIAQACRQAGISEQSYYRWRKQYGGMQIDQAKKYKELEKENARLKRLVADQALDIAMLKEVAEGNF
jgi:transposase-like protein